MRLNKTKRRQRKGRKMHGGRVTTNLELINSPTTNNENMEVDENANYMNALLGLGFLEDEIDILEGEGIDIDTIQREYRNALTSTGEDGYGLIELRDMPFTEIMNAHELNSLINTNVTKHNVANLAFVNINRRRENENDNRMNVDGGRRARKTKHNKKSRKARKTKHNKNRIRIRIRNRK
jgi:hypothetical protein